MMNFAEKISRMKDAQALKLEASSSNRRAGLPIAARVLSHLMAHTKPSNIVVSANAVRGHAVFILTPKYRALDPLLLACEEMAARLCKSADYGHELAVWSSKLFKNSNWTRNQKGVFAFARGRMPDLGCGLGQPSELARRYRATGGSDGAFFRHSP